MRYLFIFPLFVFLISCSSEVFDNSEREGERDDIYLSTYNPSSSGDVLVKGGRVLTGTGEELLSADILIKNNVIHEIAELIEPSPNTKIINAEGKWVTPGIIDIHSHMGVYAAPSLRSNSDGNEATSPVTPGVIKVTAWNNILADLLVCCTTPPSIIAPLPASPLAYPLGSDADVVVPFVITVQFLM